MDVFVHPRFEAIYERHPLVLVDVGARGGLRDHWIPAKRHLRLIGFEPDDREYQNLVREAEAQHGAVTFFDQALHDRRGPVRLRVTRNPALTSFFEPNRAFIDAFPEADRFDIVSEVEVQAGPLDDLFDAHHINDVDFLKVDTQGSELSIIRGASRILAGSGVGVEVEAEFTPLYKGQPLFADVDSALRSLGYSLFDLRPCYWKRLAGRELGGPKGQIVWADALYLKDIDAVKHSVQGLGSDARKSKVLRAISVSLLYGYWDYALQMARETGEFFDPEERAILVESLRKSGAEGRNQWRFPGRPFLAKVFHRLWKLSLLKNDAWSLGGSRLGN
jgi:FkbM family methyltransferase